MEATVDVTDQSGKSLADTPRAASQLRTEVYAELDGQASAEVQRIIAANVGKKQ
jgi:membrane fusion protein (multidrug efflux system)